MALGLLKKLAPVCSICGREIIAGDLVVRQDGPHAVCAKEQE